MSPAPVRTLRERHADTTRQVIVDALVTQLAEEGGLELTYFALARRAGVSVRTLYRYFPTRESMLDALSRRLTAIVGVEYPRTRDGLAAFVPALFQRFDRHAALVSAQIQAGIGTVRSRGRKRRANQMQEAVGAAVPGLDPERLRAAAGILTVLVSANTWQRLRDEMGLEGPQAGEITAWAIDTLWRALELEARRAR